MTKQRIKCVFCNANTQESHTIILSGQHAICEQCVGIFGAIIAKKQQCSQDPDQEKDVLIVAEDGKPIPTKTVSITKDSEEIELNTIKIKEFLDNYVVGQDSAKMALAVSVVNHYKRVLYKNSAKTDISKSNLLIAGQSGSGKTLLIKSVAKYLNVPFITVDATTLTEAGYIGQNVDTIISRLWLEANGDISLTERGIVFIDEIDKLAFEKSRANSTGNRTNGIQSALLKMVEGSIVVTSIRDSRRPEHSRLIEVNTNNILFIVGGAFSGLNEVIAERLKKKASLGFTNKATDKPPNPIETATTDDFIEYGMIPEFIGRFPLKTYTNKLEKNDLIKVLRDVKDSILDDYRFYFNIDDIEISFTDDFVEKVSEQALRENTGVRGLRAICDNILLRHMYLLPEYMARDIAKLTFHGGCVGDNPSIPTIEIYSNEKSY